MLLQCKQHSMNPLTFLSLPKAGSLMEVRVRVRVRVRDEANE